MAEGKFVSYLRVSTARQGKSGLGLEAQRKAVEDFLNGGNWQVTKEFVEVESGKKVDRPELAKASRPADCSVPSSSLPSSIAYPAMPTSSSGSKRLAWTSLQPTCRKPIA